MPSKFSGPIAELLYGMMLEGMADDSAEDGRFDRFDVTETETHYFTENAAVNAISLVRGDCPVYVTLEPGTYVLEHHSSGFVSSTHCGPGEFTYAGWLTMEEHEINLLSVKAAVTTYTTYRDPETLDEIKSSRTVTTLDPTLRSIVDYMVDEGAHFRSPSESMRASDWYAEEMYGHPYTGVREERTFHVSDLRPEQYAELGRLFDAKIAG